jgi:hypothetical protein
LDLEFTPAGLDDFEGGCFDGADGLRVGLVELELDFFQPVGDVFVVDAFYKDAPLVGVVDRAICGSLFGVEGLRFAAEDEWAEDGDGLEVSVS